MKTMRMLQWFFSLCLLLALAILLPQSASADQPDVIGRYAVHVTPQDDGTLVIEYRFSNYCATTDFPSDKPYLQVGVPNRNFDLVDWGPKSAPNSQTKVWVTSARPLQGVTSQVQLNFSKPPLAGECWDLYFTIKQRQMAYAQGSNEVSFQFTPGWFDFARIDALAITWDLPDDPSLVHKTQPAPTNGQKQAIWTNTNMAPNDKFTVTITYARSAFPNLAAGSLPSSPSNPAGSTGEADYSWVIWVIVLIIIFLIVVLPMVRRVAGDGGYGSMPGGVFYGGGGSFDGSSSPSGSGSHSGGGGGGFAGRGSSCACASCACACACAGGGRAGCARKGYDVSRLIRKRTATMA